MGVLSTQFAASSERWGGFGKMAQTVGDYFMERPELGVDPIFLCTATRAPLHLRDGRSGHVPVVFLPTDASGVRKWVGHYLRLRQARLHALLAFDYHPVFRHVFALMSRTPLIVWARDPHTPSDWARLANLRIPGERGMQPWATQPIDCTSLGGVVSASRWLKRPVLVAATDRDIAARVPEAYGLVSPDVAILPNFLDFEAASVIKSARPRVIFVARLDSVKRPWLFVETARRLPDAEFLCLGGSARAERAWVPRDLPPNLTLLGHIDGAAKIDLLSSSWVLLNTAIHEGLPMSFLEALACETPIVSTINTGGVASRFGVHVGPIDGDGLDGVPLLVDSLRRLISDEALRRRLGREGRRWVEETHNVSAFLTAFRGLLARAGLSMPGLDAV